MARCFPFPPPGYVKEDRTDEVDEVPKEEKHKEKKHKKEKKDKKREGKEKKDKERSKDKHKEKKDRKEKHRDKKKDKDKDKSSDEKRTEGRPEGHDAGEPSEIRQQPDEINNSKFVEDLGRRIGDEERKTKKDEDKNKSSDEKKTQGRPEGHDAGEPSEIRQQPDEFKDSKFVEDLGRRIGDEERRTRNQMVENFIGSDQSRSEGIGGIVEKDIGNRSERKNSSNSKKGKQSKISQQPGEIKDSKFVEDLDRRIGHEEKTRNRMVENFNGTDQSRINGMGGLLEKVIGNRSEKKNSNNYKKGKQREISQQPDEIKDSRFVEDLGRRIGDDEGRTRNRMVENFIGSDQSRSEGMGRLVEKDTDNRSERKNSNDYKKFDDKRADLQRIRDVDGATGSTVVQNFTGIHHNRAEVLGRVPEKKGFDNRTDGKDINNGKSLDDKKADTQRIRIDDGGAQIPLVQNVTGVDQGRTGSMARLMENDIYESMEGREKNKTVQKEKNKSKAFDDKLGDKHKSREKKSKKKDKDVDKEKEKHKKDKSKEKSDHKNNSQEKLKLGSKDPSNTLSIKPSQSPKGIDNSAATEGISRKRKDVEANGFLHENDIRPNKLLKPTISSNPLPENGRKLEPFQIATQCASDRHEMGNNLKADNKERKVNGIVDAPGSSGLPTKSAVANVHIIENGGSSSKPPHPDSKYLSQVLSVPKMEEWSDFDDQEWLFSSDNLQSKKPKVVSSGAEERPEVWAEAMRIESADICALPYVIPY